MRSIVDILLDAVIDPDEIDRRKHLSTGARKDLAKHFQDVTGDEIDPTEGVAWASAGHAYVPDDVEDKEDVINHELVHVGQYQRRDVDRKHNAHDLLYKIISSNNATPVDLARCAAYVANPDELMAFANCYSRELIRKHGANALAELRKEGTGSFSHVFKVLNTISPKYAKKFMKYTAAYIEMALRKNKSVSEATASEIIDAAAAKTEEPTPEQAKSGDYEKGKFKIQGLVIAIETAKGGTRSGKDKDGKEWSVVMPAHYGYIDRTEGKDGDEVDVFIGANPDSDKVFVINQNKMDTGEFDEHKCVLGTDSEDEAVKLYKASYTKGIAEKLLGSVVELTFKEFIDWATGGDTTTELAESSEVASYLVHSLLEGLKKPENFDKVSEGSDWQMYAGGNDWEASATWAAVYFPKSESSERVWLEIAYPEGLNPSDETPDDDLDACREHGEKAWKTWIKVAKRLHTIKNEYGSTPGWKDAFESALKEPEMKEFVEDSGFERTKWVDVEPEKPVAKAEPKLLEDPSEAIPEPPKE